MEEVKIKVVTGYDGDCPYREIALANFREYCARWGYELVEKFSGWEPLDRHLPWQVARTGSEKSLVRMVWRKHTLIREELPGCDWLLWLDPDCKILNMTVRLESFMEEGFEAAVTGPFGVPCYCGVDAHSAGVLLLHNSDWTKQFLQDWWDSDLEWPGWRVGRNVNCRSMGDNNWLSCKFLVNDPRRSRVKVIGPEIAGHCHLHHDPQQFLMHLYGGEPNARKNLLIWLERHVIR